MLLDLAWMLVVPSAFSFVIAYFYGRAVLAGIASARDEQHRMTPENPWFFFDREFRPAARRLGYIMLPWHLLAWSVTFWEEVRRIPNAGIDHSLEGGLILWMLLGLTCIFLSSITCLAPRIQNPLILAATGVVAVSFFLGGFLAFMAGMDRSGRYLTCALFGGAGFTSYLLAWRYVRRKLDRAWFRFDN